MICDALILVLQVFTMSAISFKALVDFFLLFISIFTIPLMSAF